MKRQLEANNIASLMPCKNIRLLEVQAGGPENLGCLPKDCRNFIENRRRLRLGDGDAEAIHKLFITMQQRDINFFHLMDVDDECKLNNVLWIHPRSKVAYEKFHDVCESIKIALREVMPNTIHRFCLWHILSKIPKEFKNVVDFDKTVVEFKTMVYDNITIDAFESMIFTQRSEGMHAYYDGYVHSMSTLKQFVEQYEITTSNKIRKEFRADFESKSKFKRRSLGYYIIPPTEDESIEAANHVGIEIYKVLERSIVSN
ncbi:protein FAR-RED IMPAIRED RESPONSE 1-like [Henckelia pumila]|uniref:protein FAR-RED IMPAIRED RESPONSE 1-like n=1 Tax=Henckelia pumila TaxID=405737 RepID=UPI003C6DC7D6